MDPLTADAPIDDAATASAPPPARLGLLELMVVVAAFGLGFGVVQILAGGNRGAIEAVLGFLFGAAIVPPAVLVVRAIARRGAGLRAGELMGLVPFAGWLLTIVGPAMRSHGDPLRGLFHLWTLTQIVAGMWSSWRLVAWSLNRAMRRRTGWLELYAHVLNALMMLLAGLLFWAMVQFS
jgi:hypothetical protein